MNIDWYERRDELNAEQVFLVAYGAVKLDRRVPGDGTKWYVADWLNGWSYLDNTIEPGDLIGEPIEDTRVAIEAALDNLYRPKKATHNAAETHGKAEHACAQAGRCVTPDTVERDRVYTLERSLTTREYFAGKALQGLLSGSLQTSYRNSKKHIAQFCYAMADEMLAVGQSSSDRAVLGQKDDGTA